MQLLLLILGATALHAQSTCGTVGLSFTSDYQYAIGTSNGGAAFAWTENGQTLAQGPIAQLDLFHFDNSLQGTSGISPAKAVCASFAPGKFGTALAIAPTGVLSYPSAGNVSVIDGTIEMWVGAVSNGSALAHYSTLFQYKAANGDQILFSAAAAGFYAKIIVGQTTTGAGGALTAWPAGAWHHVALTYSSTQSRMRVYVDGQMTQQTQGPFPMPAADGESFTIDSDTGTSPGPGSNTNGAPFLVDEVRISNDEKTQAEIQYDFSRTTPFSNNEVFLQLSGLSAGQLAYSVTPAGSTTSCGSATAAFVGIPITNPSPPTTLLPAGATSVALSVQTPAATSCGYSVNTQVSYSALTAFDKGQGSTIHSATIQGLVSDPSQVNDVYVRCAIVPDYVVHLQYRAVSAANQPFPRIAYIFAQPYSLVNPNLARYALWGFDNMPPSTLTQVRQANPGATILFQAGVVDEDLTTLPESYYLGLLRSSVSLVINPMIEFLLPKVEAA